MHDSPVTVGPDPARPGFSLLTLRGRVTAADATHLHRAALGLASGGSHVAVACGEAEYLGAAAVQVLICLGREVTRGGRRFELDGAEAHLGEWFPGAAPARA